MPALKYWDGSAWQVLPAAGPQGPQGPQGVQGANGAVGPNGGQVFSLPVGDGSALAYTVTHGLNTRGVTVTVYSTAAPYDEILCDVEHTDVNTVIVRFANAPTAGQYTVSCAAPGTQSTLNVAMDSWHYVGQAGEPAFQNSWVNFDAVNMARFRKYPDGKVRIAGIIKTGASGAVAFTLPVGYRPAGSEAFSIPVIVGAPASGYVQIANNGDVKPVNLTGGNVSTYTYLDTIEFDTESVLQTASLAAVPMDSWHTVGAAGEPVFQNSWVNANLSYGAARFRKYPNGKVRLAGQVSGGSGQGLAVFTLPVGYRPPVSIQQPIIASGGAAYIIVQTDGRVMPWNSGASNVVTTSFLDGIEFDTESVAAYVSGFLGPPLVTALPANPVDGQECYYQADATNGIIWHLRYRAGSSSAYKWEYLGGPSITSRVDTDETVATTGYVDAATVGPSITLPLNGDWAYILSANGYVASQTALTNFTAALNIAGTVGNEYAQAALPTGGPAGTVTRSSVLVARASGTVIKLQYSIGAVGTAHVRQRWLEMRPVRVG